MAEQKYKNKVNRCVYGDDPKYPGNDKKLAKVPTQAEVAAVADQNADLQKQLDAANARANAAEDQLDGQASDHSKRHDEPADAGTEKTASRAALKMLKDAGIPLEAVAAGAGNKVDVTEARAHIAALGTGNASDDSSGAQRGLDSQG